jgi:threonyl-tRNA synthetase
MDSHDHRILGPRLDLFHQQEEAPGAAFWHPRGATLYRLVENYIRSEMHRGGFREVRTPQLLSRSLWERSGHWAKFGVNMFEFADNERKFVSRSAGAIFRVRCVPSIRAVGSPPRIDACPCIYPG